MKNLEKSYTDYYLRTAKSLLFPNEAIVRIFRGVYPKLSFKKTDFHGKVLVDIGCGSGMNFLPMADLGLDLYGVEITEQICNSTIENMLNYGISIDVRRGRNDELPFSDSFSDFIMSWNAGYYMGEEKSYKDFNMYLNEFSRILKPGGKLILSVPGPRSFVFKDASTISDGYVVIKNDPYKIRNGEVFRFFKSVNHLKAILRPFFYDIKIAKLESDFFGQMNQWYVCIATKK
jgi:SAM-dependent methyltransferase